MRQFLLPLFFCLAVFAALPAMAQNTNDDELRQTLKNVPQKEIPNPYADLPQEYIDEAERYYTSCQTTNSMEKYYDCRCLASKYLDRRIDMGPAAASTSIALSISNECPDATEAAGYEYQSCMDHASLMPSNIPVKDYCTCYANTYAKLYEQISPGTGSQAFVYLQTQAYVACQNPELAKTLYPVQVQ